MAICAMRTAPLGRKKELTKEAPGPPELPPPLPPVIVAETMQPLGEGAVHKEATNALTLKAKDWPAPTGKGGNADALRDDEGVAEGENDADARMLALRLELAVSVPVTDGLRLAVAVELLEALAFGVGDGDAAALTLILARAVALRDGDGDGEGETVRLALRLGEGEAVRLALRDALAGRLGDDEAAALDEAARLDERVGEAEKLGAGGQPTEMARMRLLARSPR